MSKAIRAILIISLLNLMPAGYNSIVWAKESKENEERVLEMERALFITSASQERVLKIGLLDCILYALKNNSEILIKRIEPKLKEDDVKIARADFEPTFNLDYNLRDNTKISSSSLAGTGTAYSRDINFNIGASGKLTPGTEYNIDFLNQRYKSGSSFQTINPYYATEPKITITQPLFRDFGIMVNTADIMIAKNNLLESEKSFKDKAMEIITKTKTSYYNYIFFLESYSLDELSLGRVRDLFNIDKARYSKGLISSVDLLETETALAEREKSLLSTEASLKKAEDELKLITNLVDEPEVWNAKIELIDRPEFKVENVNLLKCLEESFKFRPDYQSAKIDLKNRNIKIKVAQNALLPTLDLVGSFGLNGLAKDYTGALDKIDTDYKDWSLGFKLSVPWGGEERAKYDQRKLEKAQALLSFKKLEQDIILEVRDKVRQANIQQRQVEVAKISQEKETQNYQAQKARFIAGQISTHDMLDYQDKLSKAELDYVKALIDYNIALINLDKAQGLTLAKNNIKLEE